MIDLEKYKLQPVDLEKYKLAPKIEIPPPPQKETSSISNIVSGALESTISGISGFGEKVGEAGIGAYKGLGSTLFGLSKFGEKIGRAILPKMLEPEETIKEKPEWLKPQGTMQNIGYTAEKIAEFLLPSSAIVKTQKMATGLVKGTGLISGLTRTGIKAGIEGLSTGGITALQQGEINDNVKTATIVGGVFSGIGSLMGKILKGTGQKIVQTKIRPSLADMEDGFNIINVNKYGIKGSLEEMAIQTQIKLNQFSNQLDDALKLSKEKVDIGKIYFDTAKKLGLNKNIHFGNIKSIDKALGQLREEIKVLPGFKVDLSAATSIKRGAGTKGAWAYKMMDPDANAVEKVYTTFYRTLREEIENVAKKSGVKNIQEINRQISDLIPISNAIIRRLPVEARNNVISLTDSIALFASVFDPRALALLGAQRLSRSARFGGFLTRLVEGGAVKQRLFGGIK